MDSNVEREISDGIKAYIAVRKDFIALSRKHPEFLYGNDNIVGIIGEYIAIRYLESKGVSAEKAKLRNERGYDLIAGDGSKISVKVITQENQNGATTRLKDPWDEVILIELGEDYKVYRLGHLKREGFEKAINQRITSSRNPLARRSMLGKKGLFGRCGEVIEGFDYL